MKKLIFGITTLLTFSSAFAVDLTPETLEQIKNAEMISKIRVQLDQQLTVIYQTNKKTDKELKNGDITNTITEDLIIRKINQETKGKIVRSSTDLTYLEVSFEKGCEETYCTYHFRLKDGHYELSEIPWIKGHEFVKANSGILPFTDAMLAIDKVNLVINKKDIVKVNKVIQNLGGYDSEN